MEFITRSDDDDVDEEMDLDLDGGMGSSGVDVGVRIEKLPLATFTIREMANEHAGTTFLEQTKVDARFAQPSDVHWWRCNAMPEHRRAVAASRGPDGLYEVAMEAYSMSDRLGWNQIVVHVHKVDDVNGPVNF
ncbi:hypothetical protein F5B17DRAFT_350898 [Nemania serpens]|nr:hypothetical protein F5B17DRAFT_350898 [Nemania serpens]